MVTGDNLETAMSIAKEAGIIPINEPSMPSDNENSKLHSSNRYRCMTGEEFRKMVCG